MTPLHLKCLMFGIPIRSGITGVVTFFCQSKQCSHVPPIVWQLPQMEMIKLNYDRLCLQAYQIADVLARLRSKVPLFGSSECLPPMFASSCSKKKTSSSSFADASNTNQNSIQQLLLLCYACNTMKLLHSSVVYQYHIYYQLVSLLATFVLNLLAQYKYLLHYRRTLDPKLSRQEGPVKCLVQALIHKNYQIQFNKLCEDLVFSHFNVNVYKCRIFFPASIKPS